MCGLVENEKAFRLNYSGIANYVKKISEDSSKSQVKQKLLTLWSKILNNTQLILS